MLMVARTSINKDIKDRKQCGAHSIYEIHVYWWLFLLLFYLSNNFFRPFIQAAGTGTFLTIILLGHFSENI